MAQLIVVDDGVALAHAAAGRVTAHVEEAIASHGSVCVCLAGGHAPRVLYSTLADPAQPWRTRIDWSRMHLFWGDERHVPPEHADSNYGMAYESLIRHVPVPAAQVHRMRGELADAHDAAREYETALHSGFAAAGRTDIVFDLVLLGIGEDAHIASIFPGSPLLDAWRPVKGRPTKDGDPAGRAADGHDRAGRPAERGRAGRPLTGRHKDERHDDEPHVAAVWAAHLNMWRITLTAPAILAARAIKVLAAGQSKAAAIHAAIERPDSVTRWPAQVLRDAGDRVEWIIDRPAAARLRVI